MEFSVDEKSIIRKHNKIIDSKHATLTEREKKLLALVISQIKREDESFKTYQIPAHEIKKALDLDSDRIYEQLKDIAIKLKKRTVLIEDLNEKSWEIFSYVDKAQYKNGSLFIKLHNDLAPYLLNLYKNYTPLQLGIILRLKGSYTLTIYEWLKKWSKIGTKEISVYDFREKLGIHDLKSYDNFAELKRRILEPAINEINTKSDLTFTYEAKSERKKVTFLHFVIKLKEESNKPQNLEAKKEEAQKLENNPQKELLFNLIKTLIPNILDSKLKDIIDSSNADTILNAIAIVEKYKAKDPNSDLAGLFISAINQGWIDSKTEKFKQEKEKKEKTQKEEISKKEAEQKNREEKAKKSEELMNLFNSFSKNKQEEVKLKFFESLKSNTFMLSRLAEAEKKGIDPFSQAIFKGSFISFLQENIQNI